jgi:hypothetical protein
MAARRSLRLRLSGIGVLVVIVGVLVALTALLTPVGASAAPQNTAPSTTSDGAENPDAEHYASVVTAIEPAAPGLTAVVHGSGGSITLTNAGDRTVTVVGYSGEDYLRFTAHEVQENSNSLTAVLNAGGDQALSSKLSTELAARATPQPAKWRSVSDTNSFTWSDFRPRWSADRRPPIVVADPHARHQVFAWAIQLKVDQRPTLIRGTVTWTGTPWLSGTALLGLGVAVLLLLGLVTVIGLRLRRARRRASRVIPLGRTIERTPYSTGAR